MRSKISKKKRCVTYKKCENVPCGGIKNGCRPHYCVPGSSRNWHRCNMNKTKCRDESKCIMNNRTKKTKNTVDAKLLHSKFPYLWRFLKPNTRKHIITLAKKPTSYLNIPFHIFPDENSKQYIKNMTKKNRTRFKTLQKKYKNI